MTTKASPNRMMNPALLAEIAKTLLALLVLVGSADALFRLAVPRLSLNSRHLAKAPERAQRIKQDSGRPSVLILGNSMTRDAIDETLLATEMRWDGLVELQASDSSIPRDWYYELKNMFVERDAIPSFLVLPVGDAYPLDRVKPPSEDLLYSFITARDLPRFFDYSGIDDSEEQGAIYLSQLSALYAFRGRTQKRILSGLIPSYPQLRLTMTQWSSRTPSKAAPEARAKSTKWVELIGAMADKHDIEVLVVPLPTEYLEGRLRERDRALCRRLGWRVVEPVAGVPFSASERPDGIHLTPAAKKRFSSLFAPVLASEVKQLIAARSAAANHVR